jgi:hypothetical protein
MVGSKSPDAGSLLEKIKGEIEKRAQVEGQAHDAEGAQATGEMITAIRSLGQYRCPG